MMTLGDIRRITAKLPDDTKIVDNHDGPKQYRVCVKCERTSPSQGERVGGAAKQNVAYTICLQDT